MELLGETGLLGLSAFLLLLLAALRAGWRLTHSQDRLVRALGFGAGGGLLAIAAANLLEHDILWEPPVGFLFWTWLAILVALSRLPANPGPAAQENGA